MKEGKIKMILIQGDSYPKEAIDIFEKLCQKIKELNGGETTGDKSQVVSRAYIGSSETNRKQ